MSLTMLTPMEPPTSIDRSTSGIGVLSSRGIVPRSRIPQRHHAESVFRHRRGGERELLDEAFEDRRQLTAKLQLQNELRLENWHTLVPVEVCVRDGSGADSIVEREPRHQAVDQHAAGHPVVRQHADWPEPARPQASVKPPSGPGQVRLGQPFKIVENADRHHRPALDDHLGGPELPLQEDDIDLAVATNPVFGFPERTAAMKNVPSVSVEIETARQVFVVEGAAPMGIWLEALPGPGPDLLTGRGVQQEFEL